MTTHVRDRDGGRVTLDRLLQLAGGHTERIGGSALNSGAQYAVSRLLLEGVLREYQGLPIESALARSHPGGPSPAPNHFAILLRFSNSGIAQL